MPLPIPANLPPLFLHPQRMNEPVAYPLGEDRIAEVHALGLHEFKGEFLCREGAVDQCVGADRPRLAACANRIVRSLIPPTEDTTIVPDIKTTAGEASPTCRLRGKVVSALSGMWPW
jgi:hypothetical protein